VSIQLPAAMANAAMLVNPAMTRTIPPPAQSLNQTSFCSMLGDTMQLERLPAGQGRVRGQRYLQCRALRCRNRKKAEPDPRSRLDLWPAHHKKLASGSKPVADTAREWRCECW
jgi:hypothetical protein